ncbi:type VI secretion system-associated FHA domain protein TagH [Pseudoalteromonas sp. ACER1]|uniref:type VI secretion system-associated FHA domain protein TagH n=1 Tax=unclassified Pseudoalteromonas TaxID=194690 RepID=UPI001F38099F|nr:MULTISPECIES: type VI secretion system-associated FHA domain protein TagH [unclassified Pseudoalteromonas]MCF2849009.1 type VI secretion system-associated FHA domain protein TagH [Pseudoalteromonas sp. PAST1]MCO7212479.1 type VI secretion system-associated FHA domain protein TagH [Pseudoalteromonas sp. ACER1]
MEVILNVTSYHRLSPEIDAKKVVKNELTFGRSEQCDWYLPDPEKVISGRHGKIVKETDGFYVYDYSTNGLFVNFSVSPLGKENKHRLSDGDVFTIGDYQIESTIQQANQPQGFESQINSFNPLQPELKSSTEDFSGSAERQVAHDSSNVLEEAIVAPTFTEAPSDNIDIFSQQSLSQPIPEDWDELAQLSATAEEKENSVPVLPAEEPVISTPAVNDSKPFNNGNSAIAANNASVSAPVKDNQIPNSSKLISSFLNGLSVNEKLSAELQNEDTWQRMGECFKLFLEGSMDLIRQRTNIKNQLKLNHTTFKVEQNNPLKFSATIDDVMQNLFVLNSASFLPANEAIKESFVDTKLHEQGLLAGATGALNGLLEQLSPDGIKAQSNNGGLLSSLPAYGGASSWRIYNELYADITDDVKAKGVLAFSDDFLKAYNGGN